MLVYIAPPPMRPSELGPCDDDIASDQILGGPLQACGFAARTQPLEPFRNEADLSLCDDFRRGQVYPRSKAPRWLDHRVLPAPVKEHHVWAL